MITRLRLYKYKRLFLYGINELTYTPQSKMQIIVGTNGCGKSSLIKELTPVPANLKKDFYEGGCKEIELSISTGNYTLISGVNGTSKHSFVKDNVELNSSGTISIQNKLVYEHFGTNLKINNILVGLNQFTSMSAPERKKWITEISPVDYSYGIRVWNNLKLRHRDILGGIKLLSADIVRLESSILDKTQINNIEKEILRLEEVMSYLNRLTTNDVVDESVLNNHLSTLKRDVTTILNNDVTIGSDVVTELTTYKEKLKMLSEFDKRITKTIDEFHMIETTSRDRTTLESNIVELRESIAKRTDPIDMKLKDISELAKSLSHNYTDIVSLLIELSALKDIEVTNTRKLIEHYNKVTHIKDTLTRRLERVISEIESLEDLKKDDNKITCGNCDNTWYHNYDNSKHTTLLKTRDRYVSHLTRVEDELAKITPVVNNTELKLELLKKLSTFIVNHDTEVFWLEVQELATVGVDILNVFSTLYRDVTRSNELHQDKQELATLEDKLKLLTDLNKTSEELHTMNLDKLVKSKDDNLIELRSTADKVTKLTTAVDKYNKVKSITGGLRGKLKQSITLRDKLISKYRNEYITELMRVFKSDYNELTSKLRELHVNQGKVKADKLKLKEYKEQEVALKILIQEISPTEGLIALSINSFLNVFINDINEVINSVWGYSIELLPCNIGEGDDLDYLFQVKVDDNEIISDIKLTSSSMQEIINLAFRVTFSKYMSVVGSPLFLDEFGRSFDPNHRITSYEVVERVLLNRYDQVFMVSHFKSMYGRFSSADVSTIHQPHLPSDNTVMDIT